MFIEDDIKNLRKYYTDLPFYIREWFFPKVLKLALSKGDAKPIQVCEACQNIGFFTRLFFPGLRTFLNKPYMAVYALTKKLKNISVNDKFWEDLLGHEQTFIHTKDVECTLKFLNRFGLLSGAKAQRYFDAILTNKSYSFYSVLGLSGSSPELYSLFTGVKKEQNFEAILTSSQRRFLADILSDLHMMGLLNGPNGQRNFEKLLIYPHLDKLASSLMSNPTFRCCLYDSNGQRNFEALLAYPKDPHRAVHALATLYGANMLVGEEGERNRSRVLMHQSPYGAALALRTLKEAGFLNDINRETVLTSIGPSQIAAALVTIETGELHWADVRFHLYDRGVKAIWLRAYQTIIMTHGRPTEAISGLVRLNKAGLLIGPEGEKNISTIIACEHPDDVAQALVDLAAKGLLDGTVGNVNRRAMLSHSPYVIVIAAEEISLKRKGCSTNVEILKAKLTLLRLEFEEISIQYAEVQTKFNETVNEGTSFLAHEGIDSETMAENRRVRMAIEQELANLANRMSWLELADSQLNESLSALEAQFSEPLEASQLSNISFFSGHEPAPVIRGPSDGIIETTLSTI